MNPRPARFPVLALAMLLPSCSAWLFSGYERTDRSRPVALVETTGGVEFGATTEFGILTLGRSAQDGPCRVHYFLGPTPLVEDGRILSAGPMFSRAEIDLKTQSVRVFDRNVEREDSLVAMWTPDGERVESVAVELATTAGIAGDVLFDPGRPLPPGAALFVERKGELFFAGLVSARAQMAGGQSPGNYYVFAGLDRVREMLAIPEVHPTDYETKFRPDNITVQKPVRPGEGQ